MRKKLFILCCLVLSSLLVFGCNNSKKNEGKNTNDNAPEYSTEDEVEISTSQLLNPIDYDITKYVTLPKNYKNMEINLNGVASFNEEDLKAYIEYDLMANPILKDTGRDTIKQGDAVKMSCEQYIEDEGISKLGDNYICHVGKEGLIEDQDQKLIGKKVGDDFKIEFILEGRHNPDVAGKKSYFQGKILGIVDEQNITYDTMTDDYIKEAYGESYKVNTVDEFKKYKEKEYKDYLNATKDATINNIITAKLVSESKVKFRKNDVEERVNATLNEVREQAKKSNVKYEDLLNKMYGNNNENQEENIKHSEKESQEENTKHSEKETPEEIIRHSVEESLKRDMVLTALVKDMNIKVNTKDFFAANNSIVYGMNGNLIDTREYHSPNKEQKQAILEFAQDQALDELKKTIKINE